MNGSMLFKQNLNIGHNKPMSDISIPCNEKIFVRWDIVNYMYVDTTIYGGAYKCVCTLSTFQDLISFFF
jgi:hypothetical protein